MIQRRTRGKVCGVSKVCTGLQWERTCSHSGELLREGPQESMGAGHAVTKLGGECAAGSCKCLGIEVGICASSFVLGEVS